MKLDINFKYLSCEKKTSSKGNVYHNVAIIQGVDIFKLYYPYEEIEDVTPMSECKGVLNLTKDKYGTHITLDSFKVVE